MKSETDQKKRERERERWIGKYRQRPKFKVMILCEIKQNKINVKKIIKDKRTAKGRE